MNFSYKISVGFKILEKVKVRETYWDFVLRGTLPWEMFEISQNLVPSFGGSFGWGFQRIIEVKFLVPLSRWKNVYIMSVHFGTYAQNESSAPPKLPFLLIRKWFQLYIACLFQPKNEYSQSQIILKVPNTTY